MYCRTHSRNSLVRGLLIGWHVTFFFFLLRERNPACQYPRDRPVRCLWCTVYNTKYIHACIHTYTHTCLIVTLQSLIYPPEKNFIGTSTILARGKSRELPTDPLFTQKKFLHKPNHPYSPNHHPPPPPSKVKWSAPKGFLYLLLTASSNLKKSIDASEFLYSSCNYPERLVWSCHWLNSPKWEGSNKHVKTTVLQVIEHQGFEAQAFDS